MEEQELDFMAGLLCMDPARRLTGPQCLAHPYLADLAGTKLAPAATTLMTRALSERASSTHMRDSYTGEGTPRSMSVASSSGEDSSDGGRPDSSTGSQVAWAPSPGHDEAGIGQMAGHAEIESGTGTQQET